MNGSPVKFHLVRYGTAGDQKYLLDDCRNTYEQIVLNATIVAHMPAALGVFISQKARKAYFIDPQTHAFQHNATFFQSDTGELKKSLVSLAEAYGPTIGKCIEEERALDPNDFTPSKLRELCRNVVEFQRTAISNEIETGPDAKFFQFVARKKNLPAPSHEPCLLVAPYFFLTSKTWEHWLTINLQCLVESAPIVSGAKTHLAAQIVLSRELLSDKASLDSIASKYLQLAVTPSVFLVWIDSLAEHDATLEELDQYYRFLEKLGQKAPTVILYGGFLSVLVARSGLVKRISGVCHSIEYGESRAVAPVGGGIPISKFYFPSLHYRTHFRDAVRGARTLGGFDSKKAFHSNVCDCPECQKIILDNPAEDFAQYGMTTSVPFKRGSELVFQQYPTPTSKAHCVRHYLFCKHREYTADLNADVEMASLELARKKLGPGLGLELVEHLSVWRQILKKRSDANNG